MTLRSGWSALMAFPATMRNRIFIFIMAHAALIGGALTLLRA